MFEKIKASIKSRVEVARINARSAKMSKTWWALIILVGYETFALSIVTGIVTPFLGGMTSSYGIAGTLILSLVAQAPVVFLLKWMKALK